MVANIILSRTTSSTTSPRRLRLARIVGSSSLTRNGKTPEPVAREFRPLVMAPFLSLLQPARRRQAGQHDSEVAVGDVGRPVQGDGGMPAAGRQRAEHLPLVLPGLRGSGHRAPPPACR